LILINFIHKLHLKICQTTNTLTGINLPRPNTQTTALLPRTSLSIDNIPHLNPSGTKMSISKRASQVCSISALQGINQTGHPQDPSTSYHLSQLFRRKSILHQSSHSLPLITGLKFQDSLFHKSKFTWSLSSLYMNSLSRLNLSQESQSRSITNRNLCIDPKSNNQCITKLHSHQ
jgi:hypothetical protein